MQAAIRRGPGAEISVTGAEVRVAPGGEDPSRASPGRASLPRPGPEASERSEERAQGPPGGEGAEAGSEPVAELEERGER